MASVASPLSVIRPFCSLRLCAGTGARFGFGFGVPHRRLFLGLGASFLDQLRRMTSSYGSSSLTTLAWLKQGVSPIEQVLKDVEWPDTFPFKDEDFSRFDEY